MTLMKRGMSLDCSVSVEVPVDQDQRGHQGPHVETDADPAGEDLHPDRRPLAGHGLIGGVRTADTNPTQISVRDTKKWAQKKSRRFQL